MNSIGVVYVARGADPNWRQRFQRFITSYLAYPAGLDHKLYIIYKEFPTTEDLAWAVGEFSLLKPIDLLHHTETNAHALPGIIFESRHFIEAKDVFLLNSSSEIMHSGWLKLLADAYALPTVGLVGCTGSFHFITEFFPDLTYPNIHIRDTAILVNKNFYCDVAAYHMQKGGPRGGMLAFEHGHDSLTRLIFGAGKTVLVVEKDGVRAPHQWGPTTYQGNLHNVLVLDRGARDYQDL